MIYIHDEYVIAGSDTDPWPVKVTDKLVELGALPIGGAPEVMRTMVEQDNQFWQARLKTMKLD